MNSPAVGDPAPPFSATDQHGNLIRLADFHGRKTLVLFFYPADDSPLCTRQACAFRDAYSDFSTAGAVVVGVSSDNSSSHQRFADNHRLPFHLLSDPDAELRRRYGVTRSLGLLPGRVTFVIDPAGTIRHRFHSATQATRHVREALRVVAQIAAERAGAPPSGTAG